jgi:hypothetical protein
VLVISKVTVKAIVPVGEADGDIVVKENDGFDEGESVINALGSGVGDLVGVFVPAVGFGA